jgi:hypothetical protein
VPNKGDCILWRVSKNKMLTFLAGKYINIFTTIVCGKNYCPGQNRLKKVDTHKLLPMFLSCSMINHTKKVAQAQKIQ